MADKFTTLVEDSRQMIDEALERINEVMEDIRKCGEFCGNPIPSSPTPSSDGFPMTK